MRVGRTDVSKLDFDQVSTAAHAHQRSPSFTSLALTLPPTPTLILT